MAGRAPRGPMSHLQSLPENIFPGSTSFARTSGGLRGSVPPRFTWTFWLAGWLTRAFQSWANTPSSPMIP